MNVQRALSKAQIVTVVGLVIGALGIAILWASGVAFPIYPPPGIIKRERASPSARGFKCSE